MFQIFNAREKRQLAFIFFTVLISGLVQVGGIVSILPFIAVATNPDIIATNKWLILLSDILSVNEQRELLLILGSASFCALVVSNLVIGFNLWLTMRFVVKTNHELSNRLLNTCVNDPLLI